MNRLFAFAAVLCLSGCVSAGVKVDESKLGQFAKGETTYDQAVAALGRPTQVITANGQKTISYAFVSAQPRPESFIPIAGAFVGGADSETSLVMLTFDGNDVLQGVVSSRGNTGSGTGFAAYSQARNSDQPRIAK